MASSEKKKKKNEMEEENIIHKVWWETYCRSNNIIQCTQKLFKVPAEVYKYVAWKAVEEKGGGGRGVDRFYRQKPETEKPSCSSLWWDDKVERGMWKAGG